MSKSECATSIVALDAVVEVASVPEKVQELLTRLQQLLWLRMGFEVTECTEAVYVTLELLMVLLGAEVASQVAMEEEEKRIRDTGEGLHVIGLSDQVVNVMEYALLLETLQDGQAEVRWMFNVASQVPLEVRRNLVLAVEPFVTRDVML